MIFYRPTDGDASTSSILSRPKHCFLMVPLAVPTPSIVRNIRAAIRNCCSQVNYRVIDAQTQVGNRDFLMKIWEIIASSPLAVGIICKEVPLATQANIYYELGVAQAMGKETVIVREPESEIPSNLIRDEYIEYNKKFKINFSKFLKELFTQAQHYEEVADHLDRNPVLVLDYLKRAYLITEDARLKKKINTVLKDDSIKTRAANSVEHLFGRL